MYRDLSDRIRSLILEKNLWGQFLAPERELATTYGVSRETVRKGLDELVREGLITRLQGKGILVSEKPAPQPSGQTVGRVMVATIGTTNSSSFLSGIAEVAGDSRWLATFSGVVIPSVRAEFLSGLSKGGADAVMLVSITDPRFVAEVLAIHRGPVVVLDHQFPGMPVINVMEDCAGGIGQAVQHLIALGHRRIGMIEHSPREANPWKYQGYVDAHRAARLPLDERLIIPSIPYFEAGHRATEQFQALAEPPTAIVACSDTQALGAWRGVEAAGLRVGRDVAIVGYGDTAIQNGMAQDLSSVHFDPVEMGRTAMRQAMAAVAAGTRAESLVLAPVELVIRASSRDVHPAAVKTQN